MVMANILVKVGYIVWGLSSFHNIDNCIAPHRSKLILLIELDKTVIQGVPFFYYIYLGDFWGKQLIFIFRVSNLSQVHKLYNHKTLKHMMCRLQYVTHFVFWSNYK